MSRSACLKHSTNVESTPAKRAGFHPYAFERQVEDSYTPGKVLRDLDASLDGNDDRHSIFHDSESFDWEEESTLVAVMMNEDLVESEQAKTKKHLEDFTNGMSSQGRAIVEDIAHVLVPTMKRLDLANKAMNTSKYLKFNDGVVGFNETCREADKDIDGDSEAIKADYFTSKEKIDTLLTKLNQAYKSRQTIWSNLEVAIDSVQNSNTGFETVNEKLEEKIKSTETRAKAFSKASKSSPLDFLKQLKMN